ncbi:hypothetical protein EYB53_008220 [Candidatus Chloroploca sp. M-50]|uniref:Uncharacterized protein n=1 Tax=Candidatus Chloroploca mongolica TaxID=2528176 RepID=A0ABS4D8C3_9CHLR|nr:hypothetical protein [Candidatus Chloroploca mongolica]MBP1465689.1 hypothetical protein [Candidatus Chloroploca mongolica]
MPKIRINLRELNNLDALDLIEETDELLEREERGGEEKEKRPINPVALQRRQEGRKWGKEVNRIMRERKQSR